MLPALKRDVTWGDIKQVLTERGLIDKPTMFLTKTDETTEAGTTITFKVKIALCEEARTIALMMTYADVNDILALVGISESMAFDNCPLSHVTAPGSHSLNLTINNHFPSKELMGT